MVCKRICVTLEIFLATATTLHPAAHFRSLACKLCLSDKIHVHRVTCRPPNFDFRKFEIFKVVWVAASGVEERIVVVRASDNFEVVGLCTGRVFSQYF